MRDALLLLIVALIAGGCWLLMRKPRRTLAGEMDVPMDLERGRAKSEAKMAAPITEADEEAAALHVAFVEKISTDEFPSRAFEVDPLTAPIPDGHLVEAETFFNDLAADRLSAFTWTAAVRETVALSSVKVVEPDPYERLEFTQDIWKAVDVQRIIAAARAEAVNAR